ncbi:MAG: ABC transporter ATP-binding protein [Alphaproteobacteria bacterium]|nr:ABC transporter ATP-binding protein [Alphaproteobacteria bacterium]
MTDAGPLLRLEDVGVRFRIVGALRAAATGVRDPYLDAVAGVSLTLAAGETLGIVGESGSGKTSLIRAIIGLVDVATGRIWFDGSEIADRSDAALRAVRRQIGMMFQDPIASLSPRKTVRSLVLEPFRIHRVALADPPRAAAEIMDMVGLAPALLEAYPHQLSGGQARRVGVARALALRPRLVMADEPTAGLDVSVQGEILNLMVRLRTELGLAYVIVTHNLPVIRHVSSRLAIMYLGRIVEEGPTRAVFTTPAHPYTRALVAAVPRPDPDDARSAPLLSGEVPSLRDRPTGCPFHPRCPDARDRCRVEVPAMRSVAPARQAACHFPLSGFGQGVSTA